jgi:D-amino peptidase
MKIFIMTDQEGVAGVVNSPDYAAPGARYYERACELTTLEVNAAIEGALEAGATDFLVADGHGHGSINATLLHPRAKLLTGRPLFYPFGCDESFDAAFNLGQHAMSNADGAHLAHTGSFIVDNQTLNGIPIGELGTNILLGEHFGVPMIFVSGDEACATEAKNLIPNIETAVVKWGVKRGSATGLSDAEALNFNNGAIHLSPEAARETIREGAKRAVERRNEIERFQLQPPFERVTTFRHTETQPKKRRVEKANDFMQLLLGKGEDAWEELEAN